MIEAEHESQFKIHNKAPHISHGGMSYGLCVPHCISNLHHISTTPPKRSVHLITGCVLLLYIAGCHLFNGFVVGIRISGDMTSNLFPEEEKCYTLSGSLVCGELVTLTCHAGFSSDARYVYVLLPGDVRALSMCELEVYTKGNYNNWVHRTCGSYFSSL